MPLPQILQSDERGTPLFKNNIFQGYEDIYIPTNEELTEEAEQKVMEKADDLIDAIGNLSQAKIFLKRLARRLIKNGALP